MRATTPITAPKGKKAMLDRLGRTKGDTGPQGPGGPKDDTGPKGPIAKKGVFDQKDLKVTKGNAGKTGETLKYYM